MTAIHALEAASWMLALGAFASVLGCVAIVALVDRLSR